MTNLTRPEPLPPAQLAERDRVIAHINEYLDWAVGQVREHQAEHGYEQAVADIGTTLRAWTMHDLAGLASVAIGRLARQADGRRR